MGIVVKVAQSVSFFLALVGNQYLFSMAYRLDYVSTLFAPQ